MILTPKQEHGAEKLSKGILQASLAEIAEIVSGFGFPKHLQGKTEGELPFFKVGDISKVWNQGQKLLTHAEHYLSTKEAEQIKTKVFPVGTVVFAKIGEAIKLNRRAILGQPSIVDNNVMGLIPRQGSVDTLYLYYFMLTVKLGDISQATTVPSVRKSDVKDIAFPLVPIESQKCIVAEIEKHFSRLDEAVANLKRVKANLKRYKACVLKAAVEGKLTEEWRNTHPDVEPANKLLERLLTERRAKWKGKGKYKEPIQIETNSLVILPDHWMRVSIDQVSSLVTDGDHNPPKRVLKGIPHLTAKHIKGWRIRFKDCSHISLSDYERTRSRFEPRHGDLIVTCVGTVGQTAIVPDDITFSADRNLAGIRLVEFGMSTRWLQIVLNSPEWQLRITQASGSTAQPHLYLGDLRALPVPLPSLTEQQQIVTGVERRLSFIEGLEAAVEANLKRADRLRQAILTRAFAGKLVNPELKKASDLSHDFPVAAESR